MNQAEVDLQCRAAGLSLEWTVDESGNINTWTDWYSRYTIERSANAPWQVREFSIRRVAEEDYDEDDWTATVWEQTFSAWQDAALAVERITV